MVITFMRSAVCTLAFIAAACLGAIGWLLLCIVTFDHVASEAVIILPLLGSSLVSVGCCIWIRVWLWRRVGSLIGALMMGLCAGIAATGCVLVLMIVSTPTNMGPKAEGQRIIPRLAMGYVSFDRD